MSACARAAGAIQRLLTFNPKLQLFLYHMQLDMDRIYIMGGLK